MADSMRYRLNQDREILLERLREKLDVDKERWKADVLDSALIHTLESIEAMEELRGEVDPTILKRLNTPVVSCRYRTSIERKTADPSEYRP